MFGRLVAWLRVSGKASEPHDLQSLLLRRHRWVGGWVGGRAGYMDSILAPINKVLAKTQQHSC